MRLLLLLALCAVYTATADDVNFSLLVAEGAVADFKLRAEYKNKEVPEFKDYPSCDGSDECPELNWDDDAQLKLFFTAPTNEELEGKTLTQLGDKKLGAPVMMKIQACFETPFTKNRKWRKPKDIIQKDKRCSKKVLSKRDLPVERERNMEMDFTYTVKSDMPRARYFLTVFLFCEVEGTNDNEYCGLATTGALSDLAKDKDVEKRLEGVTLENHKASLDQSEPLAFKTTVVDSRPTELVVCVIVLSIVSVSMLVLYFVYERKLKKSS